MTKKHFILFAETIKNMFQLDRPWRDLSKMEQDAALAATAIVCHVAHTSNDRFDETRFRRACGVPA